MALKFLLAAAAAVAIGVGLMLPGPNFGQDEPRSQIAQIDVHR